MVPELRTIPAFSVIGIEVHVNGGVDSDRSKVAAVWETFFDDGVLARIPGAEATRIVCVSTGYNPDGSGGFTVVLGAASGVGAAPVPGLAFHAVPAAQYAVFSGSGLNPEAAATVWRQVGAYFGAQSRLKRAYTTDFESYAGDSVEVHVAVRLRIRGDPRDGSRRPVSEL
jgi:predicted transcriptional regulator YdeE